MASKKQNAQKSRELTPIQTLICDEVADLLINGGDKTEVDNLIWAALRHAHKRECKKYRLPDHETLQEVESRAVRDFPNWQAELTVSWKQSKRSEVRRPEPKTVTDCIRERVIEQAREHMEEFLAWGSPEDHRLMIEILVNHGQGTPWRSRKPAVGLGQAFSDELDGGMHGYIKAPNHLVEQVERYVQCLIAADAESRDAA